MAAKAGELMVSIGADIARLNSDMMRVEQRIAQTSTKIESSFNSAFSIFSKGVALVGLAEAGRQIVDFGAQVEKSSFQMRETFGSSTDEMVAKARQLSESTKKYFSLQEVQYAFTKTADSLKRYGIEGQQYIDLVARSTDVAAAKGLELKDSIDRVESAMRGEAEASEYLGVTLNDTYMKNIAFGGALKKTWETMADAQKASYRLQEFMTQTTKYSGAAERATGTLSGAFKTLWNNVKEETAPAVSTITSGLTSIINKINEYMDKSKDLKKAGKDFQNDASMLLPGAGLGDGGGQRANLGAAYSRFKETLNLIEAAKALSTTTGTMGFAEFHRKEFEATVQSIENYIRAQQEANVELENLTKQAEDLYQKRNDVLGRGQDQRIDDMEKSANRSLAQRANLEERILQTEQQRAEVLQAIEEAETGFDWSNLMTQLQVVDNYLREMREKSLALQRSAMDTENRKIYEMVGRMNQLAASGDLSSKDAQKGINDFLKERETIEDRLLKLQERRAEVERFMASSIMTGDEWSAAAQELTQLDQMLNETSWQFNMLNGYLENLEKERVVRVDAEIAEAEAKIQAFTDKIEILKVVVNEPMYMDIDTNPALAKLNDLLARIRQVQQQIQGLGADYTVHVKMAKSPAKPWSQGYAELIQQLDSLPKGADYTIKFLTGQGVSFSSSVDIYKELMDVRNVRGLIDDMNRQLWDDQMFGRNYEIAQDERTLSQLGSRYNTEYMELLTALARGSDSGGSGGSSGQSVDIGPITIQVMSSGNARDDAITIADRIDEELASIVMDDRSRLMSAIRKKGFN